MIMAPRPTPDPRPDPGTPIRPWPRPPVPQDPKPIRHYEERVTYPCSTCGTTPVTAPADGKMHHCEECIHLIEWLADAFWATLGVVPAPGVRPHPSWSSR